ncbi:MAG: hypothetical protein JNG84_06300, partial [Archangium sp.]|nr:hypothetical protein [Archangium sp.]
WGSAGVAFNALPSVTAQLDLDVVAEGRWWSLGGGLSALGPGSVGAFTGTVTAMAFGVGPLGCARFTYGGVCGTTRLGFLHSWASGLPNSGSATTATWNIGLAPFVELPLSHSLRLRFFLSGQVNAVVTNVLVGIFPAWRTPLFSGGLGLSLGGRAVDAVVL